MSLSGNTQLLVQLGNILSNKSAGSGGAVYRSLQNGNVWLPENAPALWEQINETYSGTADDPIPYSGNMTLVNGLYYTQDGTVYLCIRDTGPPVYNALSDLVGLYVEVI